MGWIDIDVRSSFTKGKENEVKIKLSLSLSEIPPGNFLFSSPKALTTFAHCWPEGKTDSFAFVYENGGEFS